MIPQEKHNNNTFKILVSSTDPSWITGPILLEIKGKKIRETAGGPGNGFAPTAPRNGSWAAQLRSTGPQLRRKRAT